MSCELSVVKCYVQQEKHERLDRIVKAMTVILWVRKNNKSEHHVQFMMVGRGSVRLYGSNM